MPKPVDDTPQHLRPYIAHGCELVTPYTSGEAQVTCPFCSGSKLYLSLHTGQFDCKRCSLSGNLYDFFRTLHTLSFDRTPRESYQWLEEKRGLPYESLCAIGACISLATGEWIVPQYAPTGGVVNLDRYRYLKADGKYRLMATPGVEGLGVYVVGTPVDGSLYVIEGAWNLAAWHACVPDAAVIAVPGHGQWKEGWGKFTAARDVAILYDNDHPKVVEGGRTNYKARDGVERTARLMNQFSTPPKSISYLSWGGASYHDEHLTDGFDINDAYATYGPGATVAAVTSRLVPIPDDWKVSERASSVITPDACTSWAELERACEDAFEWTSVHRGALAFLMAIASSVKVKGDQLWGMLMGPGGSGKTSVMAGLAVARNYVLSESFINGLYSRMGKDQTDHSMAARLFDKCLLIKEGDTLLRAMNRDTLMAEIRDLYDGTGGKTFKTTSKKYEGLRFTILIGGTGSLRELDGAQLGGRFLNYYMPELVEKVRRAVILKAIRQQDEDSRCETGVSVESLMSREFLTFVKKSAGYLGYLRENLIRLIGELPRVTDELAEWLYELSEFVAPTRAKPSYTQDDLSEVENPVRLARQLTKMSQVLTVVLGKSHIDDYVRGLVKKIAMDTAAGRTFQLAGIIAPRNAEGMESRDCAKFTATDVKDVHDYLLFLSKISVVEQYEGDGPLVTRRVKWKLTERYLKLYNAVVK